MESLGVISVPIIVAVVYFIINLIKYALKENEKFKRFIPLVAVGLGVILGIIAYYTAPNIMQVSNVFTAIIVGGASGLSATGTNQIIKQLKKKEDDIKEDIVEKDE